MQIRKRLALASLVGLTMLIQPLAVSAADSPLTISVFTVENKVAPPADNKIYQLMEKKLGVKFAWDIAVGSKDQKIGTMIASGDYDDLLYIDSSKFIDAGACVPLETLIEKYAPNIKKHYASVWEKIKEKDGHIYCLPNWGIVQGRYTATYYSGAAMWIQKAVLKEFNYPTIKTVDEYFDLIAQYKKKYPMVEGKPTIGFSILTYDWHKFDLINPPQFLSGYPNDGNGTVDKKTFAYKVHLGQDMSRRWYKKLNEMNAAGLLDKESFVDNYDQYLAKLANGQVLGMHDQQWQFQDAMFSLITQNKILRTMAPLPIVFDKGTTPWYRERPLPNLQRGYGISVKAKDPVAILKFLDAQLSEEWQKTFQWGIKGEDYSLDAKGAPVRTPEQRLQQDDETWKLKNKADLWFLDAPKLEGTFADNQPCQIGDVPGEYLASLRPEDKELLNAYHVSSYAELMSANPPENPIYYPAWQIDPPDGHPAKVAWKKAEDAFVKDLPKVILAKPADFDKQWAAYLADLGKANLATYEKYVQDGILDRVKRWTPKN